MGWLKKKGDCEVQNKDVKRKTERFEVVAQVVNEQTQWNWLTEAEKNNYVDYGK